MTNREKMIDLLSKNTEESDLEFYSEFVDNDSRFRREVLMYTSTRGAYPICLNKQYKSTEDVIKELYLKKLLKELNHEL